MAFSKLFYFTVDGKKNCVNVVGNVFDAINNLFHLFQILIISFIKLN